MKKIAAIMMFLALGFFLSSFTEQGTWVIDPESKLTIHGSTNVNSFRCDLHRYANNDTLEYISDGESIDIKFTHNRMRIPVKGFKCSSDLITRDFLKTLKSDEYPHLEIFFRSFQDDCFKNNTYINGVVDITLAGSTKRDTVRYLAQKPDSQTILLTGTQEVKFSDFNLNAPKRMMGLVQVQESLTVEFNLVLKCL